MYIQQAYKGYNEWWRYLTTFFIVLLAQLLGALPLRFVIIAKSVSSETASEYIKSLDPNLLGISQNTGLILLMLPMVLTFFALVLSMKYIHGHSIKNIFTAAKKFRWKHFFFGFGLWGILLLGSELVNYQMYPEKYTFSFNATEFYPLLIIALLIIPLQAGAEELYLRGNLLQGVGILTRSRISALITTSLIFGLLHFNNPEVEKFGFGLSMSYYIGFGLFMGLLVILDGGLEMPLAIHAINNIYGSVFVGYEGSVLQTPALLKVSDYNPLAIVVLFIAAAILYLIVAKKVFHFPGFSKLLETIPRKTEITE